MLIYDFRAIGNRLLAIRRRQGLTQAEVAEAAGLADRTYADIERGTVNMRLETILRICQALHITPDEILTQERSAIAVRQEELLARLNACSEKDRDTALQLLEVYLRSLDTPQKTGIKQPAIGAAPMAVVFFFLLFPHPQPAQAPGEPIRAALALLLADRVQLLHLPRGGQHIGR